MKKYHLPPNKYKPAINHPWRLLSEEAWQHKVHLKKLKEKRRLLRKKGEIK